MSVGKFWGCFPCIPAKKPAPVLTGIEGSPDQDAGFWQDGVQIYSKRQVSKAVAIVLSGYDSKTAACATDVNLDPNTVDVWVQLYRPIFFEDGMACPPALVTWWMDELDRRQALAQVPIIQTAPVQPSLFGPTTPTTTVQSQRVGQGQYQGSGVFGTSYMKVPFVTPDGTIVSQTVTTPKPGGPGNTIVISSPSQSQPNIRVVYQDPTMANQQQSSVTQPSRPNSSPPVTQLTYDVLGSPFQQQLTAVQQLKQAEQALAALQAQTATLQAQNAQNSTVPGQRGGRGPPYTLQ